MLNGEKKVHFKMYKAGRQWLVAGIAAFGLGAAVTTLSGQTVSAATTDSVQTSPVQSAAPAQSASSAADTRTSTSAGTSTSSAASNVAPSATSSASLKGSSTQLSSASTPNSSAESEELQSSESAEVSTSSASDATLNNDSLGTGSESKAPSTPTVAYKANSTDTNVNLGSADGSKPITQNDITDNFTFNSNPKTGEFDSKDSNTVVLTPDEQYQSGNLTLNTKIDLP